MLSKLMSLFLVMAAVVGCGTKTQEVIVTGKPGQDGISMGLDVSSSAPSCLAGGSTIKSFVDENRNSTLDLNEVVKQSTVICNGVNGTNGTNGVDGTSVSVSTATAECGTAGGIVVSAGMLTYPICNGAKGDMGPSGANGLNGANGPAGAAGLSAYQIWLNAGNSGSEQDFLDSLKGTDGSDGLSAYQVWLTLPGNAGKTEAQFISSLTGPTGNAGSDGQDGKSAYQTWLDLGNTGTEAQFIASLKGATGSTGATGPVGPQGPSGSVGNLTPVQLCPGDSATFKEYGFIVGTDLYAVYFDKNQPIAFLAKLSPGNYVTTNGANCYFSYTNSGTTITLTNSNNSSLTQTVPLNSGSGSGGSSSSECSLEFDYDSAWNGYTKAKFKFSYNGETTTNGWYLDFNFGSLSYELSGATLTSQSGYPKRLYADGAHPNLQSGDVISSTHNITTPSVTLTEADWNSSRLQGVTLNYTNTFSVNKQISCQVTFK